MTLRPLRFNLPMPLTLQYLGQTGFLLTDGAHTLIIDPYLSYSVDNLPGFAPEFWIRNYPPPVAPSELRNVDLVLCSHDHLDHADPESLLGLAAASPHCRFAGPHQTVALFHQIGLVPARTFAVDADQPFAWHDATVKPIAAAHEDYEVDADGHHRFLGFLIHWHNRTLYHAGDTIATPQLSARLERERIDVGLLPVNGADDARRQLDIVGNMDVASALTLADRHRFGLVVPMHFDLYPNNGLTPAQFAAAWFSHPAAKRVPLKLFEPGEHHLLA